jgi:hypothetical protein
MNVPLLTFENVQEANHFLLSSPSLYFHVLNISLIHSILTLLKFVIIIVGCCRLSIGVN